MANSEGSGKTVLTNSEGSGETVLAISEGSGKTVLYYRCTGSPMPSLFTYKFLFTWSGSFLVFHVTGLKRKKKKRKYLDEEEGDDVGAAAGADNDDDDVDDYADTAGTAEMDVDEG